MDKKDYVLTVKDGKPTQRDFGFGTWATPRISVWAYSDTEGDFILRWGYPGFNNQLFSLSNYDLKNGWNFIYITPEMIGKSLGEIKGGCSFEKVYTYLVDGGAPPSTR